MKRRIFMEVSVDDKEEQVWDKGGPLDYVCNRIERLHDITFHQAILADEDDECEWSQYIYTLLGWCMDHEDPSDENEHVPTYEEWKENKRRYKNV